MDLVSFIVKDLVTEATADIFGDTNPTSSTFSAVGTESGIDVTEVNGLVEEEAQVGTDINTLTGGNSEGYTTNVVIPCDVEDFGDVLECK